LINDVISKIANLKTSLRGGVIPAMSTPLESSGVRVRVEVLPTLVDFLIGAGVSGLFVGGSTGEGITLDHEERIRLHANSMDAINQRVPALIHVGAANTTKSIHLARHAEAIGADAIVAVTPYFYPIHDDALLEYYMELAAAVPNTPIFAYDIPHMAVNGISPLLLKRLANQIPSFAGLKSSSPDAQKIRKLIDVNNSDKLLLAGNESIALGLLAIGVDGLISGLSTSVPEPFIAMMQAFEGGQFDDARRYQHLINQILNLLPSGERLGALKAILSERGIVVGPPVPPRPTVKQDWAGWQRISQILGDGI
jgi:dihydrodipicolinate synthase/N-acetylneuraminate lyase